MFLESVKLAKSKGARILSIVNVTTSSLARASDASYPQIAAPKSELQQLRALQASSL
jgi:fructoselysine-6-P-deglycase FrlB-like protein